MTWAHTISYTVGDPNNEVDFFTFLDVLRRLVAFNVKKTTSLFGSPTVVFYSPRAPLRHLHPVRLKSRSCPSFQMRHTRHVALDNRAGPDRRRVRGGIGTHNYRVCTCHYNERCVTYIPSRHQGQTYANSHLLLPMSSMISRAATDSPSCN